MSLIFVEKLSEVNLRVDGEFSILEEIKQYFTYKVPGYQFNPKYKARLWDGTISLFNLHTKKLPLGLMNRLITYCESNGIEIQFKANELYESPIDVNEITREEVIEYMTSLNLPAKIVSQEHQIDAIYNCLKNKKLSLISPTSSGKSLIIFVIFRWLLDKEMRTVLIVPNISLVNQMFADFDDYCSVSGFSMSEVSQKLFSGQSKELSKPLLITTWQSLSKVAGNKGLPSKVLNSYDATIIDEAHTLKGKELQNLMAGMTDVSYRIGTTGTQADKVNQLIIEGFVGPVYKVISTKELMDAGKVSSLKIKALVLKYSAEECQIVKPYKYADEISYICMHEKRNKFVRDIALSCQGTTLVLFNFIEKHGKPIYRAILEKSTRPVYYVSGEVSGDDREMIRLTANKEDCIIVASIPTFSTGINIPNIRNVIFAAPSKSSIRILQSIGRGLRLHKDKDGMVLIDIVDDFKVKKKNNYALDHFDERLKIYQSEQFDISIKEIPF